MPPLFSERELTGLMARTMAVNEVSPRLRNRFRNIIFRFNGDLVAGRANLGFAGIPAKVEDDFFNLVADDCLGWWVHDPHLDPNVRWKNLGPQFEMVDWNVVYDLVEAYLLAWRGQIATFARSKDAKNASGKALVQTIQSWLDVLVCGLNDAAAREACSYRIVNYQFTRIIADVEIQAVDDTLDKLEPYAEARAHLEKAVRFLGDRLAPDYANAAKEAISAVEAATRFFTNDPGITLGKALKMMPAPDEDRRQLFEAMKSLYTFASNVARHGNKPDGQPPTEAEARFMVITSSAFLGYLLSSTPSTPPTTPPRDSTPP